MRKQSKEVKARIKEQKLKLKEERLEMIEVLIQEKKVQPVVPELIVEDFSTNPDYRKCTMCTEYKLLKEYYQNKNTGYYHSRCKVCHLKYSSGKLVDYYQDKYKTKGGSERILPKAGTFVDIYQEEQVSWLLQLIGWNKDGNVWVKEGIKKVVDGQIVWDKIPEKKRTIKVRKSRTVIDDNDIKDIIELRKNGLLMREIALIYKCSKTLIGKLLIKHYEKTR